MLLELCAALIDVVRMTKRSIAIEEQLGKCDQELQESQCELKVASAFVIRAPCNTLGKSEKVR